MEQRQKQAVEMSPQDLEAAVRYLSAEEARRKEERRRFTVSMIATTAAGIMTYICLLGLVVVWFNRTLGYVLLGIAALAMAVFGAISFSKEGKTALDGLRLSTRAPESKGLTGRLPSRYVLGMMVAGLAFLSCLGGFGWMLYGLVTLGEVGLPSVGLIVLSILIASTALGLYSASVQRYHARVSSLRGELESHLQAAEPEAERKVVTGRDLSVLARAERTQQRIALEQAVKSAAGTEEAWAVWKSDPARAYIRMQETTERIAISDALDALQFDPQPPDARPVAAGQPTYWIEVQGHRIWYALDEANKRITIHEIRPGEEAGDVS